MSKPTCDQCGEDAVQQFAVEGAEVSRCEAHSIPANDVGLHWEQKLPKKSK